MTAMHDPGPIKRPTHLSTKAQNHSAYYTKNPHILLMNSDDLPVYPTPQQATYAMSSQESAASRRTAQTQHYQQYQQYQKPGPSGPQVSPNTYNNGHAPQQEYNYSGARPVPQQYYSSSSQQQPYSPVSSSHSLSSSQTNQPSNHSLNSYQHGGYQQTQQKPPPQVQQHRQEPYRQAPSVSQASRVTSASSGHYSPSTQTQTNSHAHAHPQSQGQGQSQVQVQGQFHTSHQYQQQQQHAPILNHGTPSTSQIPQGPQISQNHSGFQGPPPPKKKPSSNRLNNSHESFEEPPKLSSKQRLEAELRATFDRVDKNHSGRISARELSSALINFDHTGFQSSTVRLMIKLFSSPSSGSSSGLNFDQFVSLWKYLTAYKKLFVAADVNKSGDISFGEFQRIIEQIGYKLNVDLVLHLFQKFANKESHADGSVAVGKLKFDAFIELLVYLRKLTDIFKQYDKKLTGVATIDYSDFLFEISSLT